MDKTGQYTAPAIADYGDLVAITTAIDFDGVEDGANKNLGPHHDFSGITTP